jgi:hypothetical protein
MMRLLQKRSQDSMRIAVRSRLLFMNLWECEARIYALFWSFFTPKIFFQFWR